MADDEDAPASTIAQPKVFEEMSVEALQAYRLELEREIARVDAAVADKRKARHGAESLFRR
jgi:uncharacterized small protein (DUF1192 family)